MRFFRVEFVKANGTETFQILECASAHAAEAAIKLECFNCKIIRVVEV